jgi:DNA-binding NarL/FixJ family response regulator
MGEENTISVYLADDHAMVREALAVLMAKEPDFTIIGQGGNGLEVLEQVRNLAPDVAVLDIAMPGLNGLDACREITKKCKGTAILILTMHDDEQFIAAALQNGAGGYLLKESAAQQLCEAIRRVKKGELYLGPGIPRSVLHRVGHEENDPHKNLTSREREVLQLVAEGKTNREIASILNLAVKTVDTHRTRLMRKLNIHDQTALVKYALRRGVVSLQ